MDRPGRNEGGEGSRYDSLAMASEPQPRAHAIQQLRKDSGGGAMSRVVYAQNLLFFASEAKLTCPQASFDVWHKTPQLFKFL